MLNYSNLFDNLRKLYSLPKYYFENIKTMPLRYFFELTYRCNLKCPYCYVGESQEKEELSTSEWLKIVEQLPPYAFVTLVGGEPLIREDFPNILEAVSKKVGSKTSVVTNGVLINDENIKAFVKNKLMLLSVSIDGYEKTHDMNRNCEGLFDKVTSNLENLNVIKKRPKVDIKTIILNNNLDDLVKLYKYCGKQGFEFFSLSFLRTNNLKQNCVLKDELGECFYKDSPVNLYFDMEHFKEVFKELKSIQKTSKCVIRFAPKFEKNRNVIEKIEEFFTLKRPIKEAYKLCMFPFSDTFITPEGLIYPCLSVCMGDLKKNTIKEVFNSPCYKNFRSIIKKDGFLPACQMCCELCVK